MIIKKQNIFLFLLIFDTAITSLYNRPEWNLILILTKLLNIFFVINFWNLSKLKFTIKKDHLLYVLITFISFSLSTYITGSLKPILFISQVIFYFFPLYYIGLNLTRDTLYRWILSIQFINIIFSFIGYIIKPITISGFSRYSSIFTSGNSSGLFAGTIILINIIFFGQINRYFKDKYKTFFIISTLNSMFLMFISSNRLSIFSLLFCLTIFLLRYFFENFNFTANTLVLQNISKIKPFFIFFLITIFLIFLIPSFFYDSLVYKSIYLLDNDRITNGRFEMWDFVFNKLELFGSPTNVYYYIEGTILSVIYRFGIIPAILFFLPYFYLFLNLIIKRNLNSFSLSFYLLTQLLTIWFTETNFVVLSNMIFSVFLGYEERLNNRAKFYIVE